jgi:putative endonuclease
MQAKDMVGQYGERVAGRFLRDSGLQVLELNWRCSRGEVDIIARDGAVLVFCEVKTRSSGLFGDPSEAVGPGKMIRLRSLALQWLTDHPGGWDEIRFDVITVLRRHRKPAQVRHLRGAF